MSITNRRFVVNEEGYIIDTLNPIYNPRCQHFRGREPEDEKYLRERLFMERLRGLMEKLLIDPDSRIRWVILSAIAPEYLRPSSEYPAQVTSRIQAPKGRHAIFHITVALLRRR